MKNTIFSLAVFSFAFSMSLWLFSYAFSYLGKGGIKDRTARIIGRLNMVVCIVYIIVAGIKVYWWLPFLGVIVGYIISLMEKIGIVFLHGVLRRQEDSFAGSFFYLNRTVTRWFYFFIPIYDFIMLYEIAKCLIFTSLP